MQYYTATIINIEDSIKGFSYFDSTDEVYALENNIVQFFDEDCNCLYNGNGKYIMKCENGPPLSNPKHTYDPATEEEIKMFKRHKLKIKLAEL